jgi:hypothetical protein
VLTATIGERIPLLQYTATYRDEGAPRVGFTRGGFSNAERIEAQLVREKLNYMHANPVTRELIEHPKDWAAAQPFAFSC